VNSFHFTIGRRTNERAETNRTGPPWCQEYVPGYDQLSPALAAVNNGGFGWLVAGPALRCVAFRSRASPRMTVDIPAATHPPGARHSKDPRRPEQSLPGQRRLYFSGSTQNDPLRLVLGKMNSFSQAASSSAIRNSGSSSFTRSGHHHVTKKLVANFWSALEPHASSTTING